MDLRRMAVLAILAATHMDRMALLVAAYTSVAVPLAYFHYMAFVVDTFDSGTVLVVAVANIRSCRLAFVAYMASVAIHRIRNHPDSSFLVDMPMA